MKSLALLVLRLAYGGFMIGHGGQKLFGWFEGPGLTGTQGMMEHLTLQPSNFWALMAGMSEFGGGSLTLLGLMNPVGPLATVGSMGMAVATVHKDKPIWVTKGGAELPVTNIAIASALALAGPGALSLDKLFGTRLPRWFVVPGAALVGAGIYAALNPEKVQQQARDLLGTVLPGLQQMGEQAADQVTATSTTATTAATSTSTTPPQQPEPLPGQLAGRTL